MQPRRTLRAAALTLTTLLTLSLAAPPAQAEGSDPLSQLLSPTIEDPVIALLAALPTPYRPYTGPICVSGSAPSCAPGEPVLRRAAACTE